MKWLWRKLGVVSREEMAGLQIDATGNWDISAPAWDAEVAFAALPTLIGGDCTMYLEGGSHSKEIAAFIETHQVIPHAQIARGTIWPRQEIHHLPAITEVCDGLSRLANHHAFPEICEHLVIYQTSRVLVDWYDAFDRAIFASSTIPEKSVREFAENVGATFRVEAT